MQVVKFIVMLFSKKKDSSTIYKVVVHEMNHYQDEKEQYCSAEFQSFELAKEYAKRLTRNSLESFRKPNQNNQELKDQWFGFGEYAFVEGGKEYYSGSEEIDFFIANPASKEETNYGGLVE